MPNLSPQRLRKLYSLYDNKISTEEEAAEGKAKLEKQVEKAGYRDYVDRRISGLAHQEQVNSDHQAVRHDDLGLLNNLCGLVLFFLHLVEEQTNEETMMLFPIPKELLMFLP